MFCAYSGKPCSLSSRGARQCVARLRTWFLTFWRLVIYTVPFFFSLAEGLSFRRQRRYSWSQDSLEFDGWWVVLRRQLTGCYICLHEWVWQQGWLKRYTCSALSSCRVWRCVVSLWERLVTFFKPCSSWSLYPWSLFSDGGRVASSQAEKIVVVAGCTPSKV